MIGKAIQKGNKYFEIWDKNNNQYRIFFRASKNKTQSFSICIIHDKYGNEKSYCKKSKELV